MERLEEGVYLVRVFSNIKKSEEPTLYNDGEGEVIKIKADGLVRPRLTTNVQHLHHVVW